MASATLSVEALLERIQKGYGITLEDDLVITLNETEISDCQRIIPMGATVEFETLDEVFREVEYAKAMGGAAAKMQKKIILEQHAPLVRIDMDLREESR